MKHLPLTAIVLVLLPASYLLAQHRGSGRPVGATHNATAPEPGNRFEIVQSGLTRLVTLKVDKFTGSTEALSIARNGREGWGPVRLLDHHRDAITEGRVNYQVFASGLAARDTFLLNVHTGATWRLIEDDAAGGLFWRPLE